MVNGESVLPDPPEAECFKFARLGEESGLDESYLFTLTWFYRAFGLYQPIPRHERRFISQRTVDIADRFISLWICFNSILRKHYGERLSDHRMISMTEHDFENANGTLKWKEYYDTMCDAEYRRHLKRLRSLLPIKNMKTGRLHDMTNASLIKIVYQIRCNLFHGRKDPTETNTKDYQLVRLAFFLFAPLVIEYARKHDLIVTFVHPEFEISQLENGICFDAV